MKHVEFKRHTPKRLITAQPQTITVSVVILLLTVDTFRGSNVADSDTY